MERGGRRSAFSLVLQPPPPQYVDINNPSYTYLILNEQFRNGQCTVCHALQTCQNPLPSLPWRLGTVYALVLLVPGWPLKAHRRSRRLTASRPHPMTLRGPSRPQEMVSQHLRHDLPLSDALCRAAVLLLGPQVPRLCGLGSCRSVLTAEARKLLE